MAQPKTIPLDSQLCFSLYSTSIAINRTYKPLLDELGITYPQYLVLSALWERDGQTISGIADRLSLEPSTITPLVKRLEQAGFLSRRRNQQDEREVKAHLTAKGKGLRSEAGCLNDRLVERSGLTVDRIIALNKQIQSLREALTRSASKEGA
jgi:DNA-binding MarR family transcriptional regulator